MKQFFLPTRTGIKFLLLNVTSYHQPAGMGIIAATMTVWSMETEWTIADGRMYSEIHPLYFSCMASHVTSIRSGREVTLPLSLFLMLQHQSLHPFPCYYSSLSFFSLEGVVWGGVETFVEVIRPVSWILGVHRPTSALY